MNLLASLRAGYRDPNPVFVRELQSIFRTPAYQRFLVIVTGGITLILLLIGTSDDNSSLPVARVGQLIFHSFFALLTLVLSQVAPAYGATVIANERQIGTYESLVVSGMSARRIVWGKFAACFVATLTVVMALLPVAAITLIFGGVAPVSLVLGFLWVLGALAPCLAFGIVVSTGLRSTWLAVMTAYFTATPLSWIYALLTVVLAEVTGSNTGPFWFAEAFATTPLEPGVWFHAFLVPLWMFGAPTTLFLLQAERLLRAPAADGATPLKLWVALVQPINALMLFGILMASHRDTELIGVTFSLGFALLLPVYAILLLGEPHAPIRVEEPSVFRRLGALAGSGAAPTLRFTLVAVATGALLAPLATLLAQTLRDARTGIDPIEELRLPLACTVIALGTASCAMCFAAFVHWVAARTRNPLLARVLGVATALAWSILPILLTAFLRPAAFQEPTMPFAMRLSPLAPAMYAFAIQNRTIDTTHFPTEMIPLLVLSLAGTLLFTLAVELECARHQQAPESRAREPR